MRITRYHYSRGRRVRYRLLLNNTKGIVLHTTACSGPKGRDSTVCFKIGLCSKECCSRLRK